MKRLVYIAVIALVAIGAAVAAVEWPSGAGARETVQPPTTASLMPAYVQAAKARLARLETEAVDAAAGPPTRASLLNSYVQAAKMQLARARALARAEDNVAPATPPITASLMDAYVQAAKLGYR